MAEYRKNGEKLKYASETYEFNYADLSGLPFSQGLEIAQTQYIVYNSLFFDWSTFKYYEFGDLWNSYSPKGYAQADRIFDNDSFKLYFYQSRDTLRVKPITRAFNAVIGQIGGYTALIWMVITFCLSGYENHKFRLSLLSNIYLCTEDGPDAPACETEEQSRS